MDERLRATAQVWWFTSRLLFSENVSSISQVLGEQTATVTAHDDHFILLSFSFPAHGVLVTVSEYCLWKRSTTTLIHFVCANMGCHWTNDDYGSF
jgi:hypothetical protein